MFGLGSGVRRSIFYEYVKITLIMYKLFCNMQKSEFIDIYSIR